MNRRRLQTGFTALFSVAAALGCNSEKVPRLGRVEGTVTLDGQPVADAMVQFAGVKPEEPPSSGKTDVSGKYELYYSRKHKGATIGEHIVYISTYQAADEDNPQVKKETIPAIYNGKSELKETVKRGTNKIDFALKAGEIIHPDQVEAAAAAKAKKKGKK